MLQTEVIWKNKTEDVVFIGFGAVIISLNLVNVFE